MVQLVKELPSLLHCDYFAMPEQEEEATVGVACDLASAWASWS